MKNPRFMTEYANYQKKTISASELMRQEIKEKTITKIDDTLRIAERGLITVDEAMKLIMNCAV